MHGTVGTRRGRRRLHLAASRAEPARRRSRIIAFMPTSQDKVAWWIVGQSHAHDLVCAGRDRLDDAFTALSSQWSSLPGASQSQVSVTDAKARYDRYLAEAMVARTAAR